MQKVNLSQKFELFSDYWNPKIVGELNKQQIKLAKFQGEFIWHCHPNEDELFFVVQGQLIILFRESEIVLNPGEFVIVPKGVEHKPVAKDEVHVMLLEPTSTLNTGNVKNEQTVDSLQRI